MKANQVPSKNNKLIMLFIHLKKSMEKRHWYWEVNEHLLVKINK